MLKLTGYLVSSVSVILLGIVSWKGASEQPILMFCLILGMATSILGMLFRWLSYQREHKPFKRAAEERMVEPGPPSKSRSAAAMGQSLLNTVHKPDPNG
jgi:hypothetical protein